MQGPSHLLFGIAWQKTTDYSLKKTDGILHHFLPVWVSVRHLRWLIIPAGAFFIGHGLLDLFTKITFHNWDITRGYPPQAIYVTLVVLFNLILGIRVFKRWVIRDWKNLKIIFFWNKENRALWRNYRYLLAISFAWLIPDAEHPYHWIRTGSFDYTPDLGYPIHQYAKQLWLEIPKLKSFIDSLPTWFSNEWAFFIEFGVILLGLFIIQLFSDKHQHRQA